MSEDYSLIVCQWNILLDSNLAGCIDYNMRSYASPQCLIWAHRKDAIVSRIKESAADVVLLEECSAEMFQDLKDDFKFPAFCAWHASEFDSGSDRSELDVAMLVNLSKLEVIGSPKCQRLHELCSGSDLETVLQAGQDGDIKPTSYALLSASIRRRDRAECIVIGGTHLRWEYEMPEAGAKAVQALAAACGLRRHASDARAAGWALCGDFNSKPSDPAYLDLTGSEQHTDSVGSLLRAELAGLGRPLFASAFREARGAEPLFTRKKNTPDSQYCLDYVLLGGRLAAAAASIGPEAAPPPYDPQGDGSDLPCLPCAEWPSDHLPLVVELVLRPDCAP
jgi:hypothetical protein